MKRTNKKGFTIVELVIVIAVIAILAAVLIPTYSSLVKKANVSKDTQLIKNLNTALAADENKHNTMTDALNAAAEFGYDIAKINASATDNEILWDSVNDVFCYYDADAHTVKYISEVEKKDIQNYQYWKIYTQMPTQQTYSIYWNAENAAIDELSVGFDCGKFASDLALTYKGNETAKSVTFRTNGGTLTIDAASDTVEHYGSASVVNVQAVDTNSYHLYGNVGTLNVTKGHVVIEEKGTVSFITKTGTDTATVENKGNIGTSLNVEINGTKPTQTVTDSAARLTNAGGYVKLTADQTISDDLTLDKDTVIDLNGHTITFAEGKQLIVEANVTILDSSTDKNGKIYTEKMLTNEAKNLIIVKKGTLTLNSGSIEGCRPKGGSSYNATVGVTSGATLVVNGGSIINNRTSDNTTGWSGPAIIVTKQGTKCYINGGTIYAGKHNALCGNGSKTEWGTYIEINGGTLKSGDIAIYQPQVGTLNINGGYIEGLTAVYQKAGTMTITGGVFKATGEKEVYNYNGNGSDPTGDCIIIDSCNGYGNGATVANILLDSTKITSANAKAVAGYVGNNAPANIIWNGEEVKSIEVEN